MDPDVNNLLAEIEMAMNSIIGPLGLGEIN